MQCQLQPRVPHQAPAEYAAADFEVYHGTYSASVVPGATLLAPQMGYVQDKAGMCLPLSMTGEPRGPAMPVTFRYGMLSSNRVISADSLGWRDLGHTPYVAEVPGVAPAPTWSAGKAKGVPVPVETRGALGRGVRSKPVPVEVETSAIKALEVQPLVASASRCGAVSSSTDSTRGETKCSPSNASSTCGDDLSLAPSSGTDSFGMDAMPFKLDSKLGQTLECPYVQDDWSMAQILKEAESNAAAFAATQGPLAIKQAIDMAMELACGGKAKPTNPEGSAGKSSTGSPVSAGRTDRVRNGELTSPMAIVRMPVLKDPTVGPFSQAGIGQNLLLSQDGYTAARSCGCRESVAIGSTPLQRQGQGLYFELKVLETADGWLGGIGVGMTHMRANDLLRIPDKAWRVPGTFMAGYSGCMYLNGKELRCAWEPDKLRAGQHVGCLLTGDGKEDSTKDLPVRLCVDMIIYVDGARVLRIDGSLLHEGGLRNEPLFPIIDVFNATLAVQLLPRAAAPTVP